ncbi:hypothetical protein [Kribbella lupini]|uniref:Uncharacterized protein n=1 Tax=Kribbella lupini TaxID=291602 RepID=A0ABN2CRP5_9ACTN
MEPHNETRWDAIQVAYFTSAATSNYLTAPIVFVHPDVETDGIEPWSEAGRTRRRRLPRSPSPDPIANHNPDWGLYHDKIFRQRRMAYQPDVIGSPIAHYTHKPKVFDGFLFYILRLVHLRDEHNVANQEFAPMTIDLESVSVVPTSEPRKGMLG